jgi:transcriptional regulator with XRE-family HTH domain
MKLKQDACPGWNPENALLVGGLLRERRQSRGLTPEEVGRALRFGARQIVAVEEGRFADLPPQPYARGLLSAYATLIGIEPEELLRVCGRDLSGEKSDQRTSLLRRPASERFSWREWTVPFVLACAVALLVSARAVFSPAPAELSAPAAAPAWLRRPLPRAAAPEEIAPPPSALAAVPQRAAGVRVILRSEGSTWAEAAPDGAAPRRFDLGPGQNLELTALERLALALGDAGVVRVSVNGRELGFIGLKGETKTGLLFAAPKTPTAGAAGAAAGD